MLSLFQCFGVEFTAEGLRVEPLLRKDDTELDVKVTIADTGYNIHITKPEGFCRTMEGVKVTLDGQETEGTLLPVVKDGKVHEVTVSF